MEEPQPKVRGLRLPTTIDVTPVLFVKAMLFKHPLLFPPALGAELNCPEAWLPVLDQLFAAIQTYVNTTLHNVRRKDGTMVTVAPPQLVVEVCEERGGALYLEFKPAVWPEPVTADSNQVSLAMVTAYHDALVEGMVCFARHLCSMA